MSFVNGFFLIDCLILFSFHLGSQDSSDAQTFEPNENSRGWFPFIETPLGNERLETTKVRKSGK